MRASEAQAKRRKLTAKALCARRKRESFAARKGLPTMARTRGCVPRSRDLVLGLRIAGLGTARHNVTCFALLAWVARRIITAGHPMMCAARGMLSRPRRTAARHGGQACKISFPADCGTLLLHKSFLKNYSSNCTFTGPLLHTIQVFVIPSELRQTARRLIFCTG